MNMCGFTAQTACFSQGGLHHSHPKDSTTLAAYASSPANDSQRMQSYLLLLPWDAPSIKGLI